MATHERDIRFEILKGLGIVSVVLGHVYSGTTLRAVVYLFHMPLFFLVGGYFYRASERSTAQFVRELVRRHLVPYVAFIVAILLTLYPEFWRHVLAQDVRWVAAKIFRLLFGGEKLTGHFGVFWFPTCYLFTLLSYDQLRRRLHGLGLMISAVASLLLGYGLQYGLPKFWLPWALNVVPTSLFYFYLGDQLKVAWGTGRSAGWAAWLLMATGLLYGAGVALARWPAVELKGGSNGWVCVTPLASVGCVWLLLELSSLLAKRSRLIAQVLTLCGSASLVMMYLHQPIHLSLVEVIGKHHRFLVSLVSIGIPVLAFLAFKRHTLLARVFLGRSPLRGE